MDGGSSQFYLHFKGPASQVSVSVFHLLCFPFILLPKHYLSSPWPSFSLIALMKSNAEVEETCALFSSEIPRTGVVHTGTKLKGAFLLENFKTLIQLTKSQSAFIISMHQHSKIVQTFVYDKMPLLPPQISLGLCSKWLLCLFLICICLHAISKIADNINILHIHTNI